MRYLKLYESFNEIDSICDKYGITNYTINSDGSVDVDGDVLLNDRKLTKLPLKFGKVSGYFNCGYNKLTSLEGCPNTVGGYFYCGNNQLVSLEGCPTNVGGSFYCSYNQLVSLEGCTENIGGEFYCSDNPVFEVWKLFNDKDKIEFFNYCDPIQDGVIILERLNAFLQEIGKPTVTSVKGYKCI